MKMKKRLQKLSKKISKMLYKYSNLPKHKELKLIDKWYPGPGGLTNEEVLMRADFESLHSYQLFIAVCRKHEAKIIESNPEFADLLNESSGTRVSI